MSPLYAASIILAVTGVDLTGKEGYLIKNNAGVHAVNTSATVPAIAVCLEGDVAAKQSSIAMLGALDGAVRVKSSGAIAKFDKICQAADGTLVTDAGAGARVQVGTALEAAAAGDLFQAILHTPVVLA